MLRGHVGFGLEAEGSAERCLHYTFISKKHQLSFLRIKRNVRSIVL
jgi:hypothetical protein